VSSSAQPTITLNPPAPWQGWLTTIGNELYPIVGVFRTLPLAIILLSLLAIGILVGVFMPQEGLVEAATIKQQFGTNYYLFKAMGLFTVYSSAWFITVEVLFFINLLCGSFQWLKPAWLAATRREFCGPEHIVASPNHFQIPSSDNYSLALVTDHLKQRGYQVFYPSADSNQPTTAHRCYAAKGNFSRLGPVVAHLGILCLLLGSVYGAFTGFKANQSMVPGQTFQFPQFEEFHPNMAEPYWQGNVPNWTLKLHDFKVHYYAQNPATPQQYYSDLEVLDNRGHSLKRQTLSVNTPLQLDGFMIYQASFAPTGKLFLSVDGNPTTVEINSEFQNRPISMSPLGNPTNQTSLLVFPFFTGKDPGTLQNNIRVFIHQGNRFVGAAPGKMPENLQLFEGESGTLAGHTIQFLKPELTTGFLIKKAPETPWVYLAFGIISLGTLMCVFSQRQIWVAVTNNTVYVHYKTNKAKLSFARELLALEKALVEKFSVDTPPHPSGG